MRQAMANPIEDRVLSGATQIGPIVAAGTLIFAGLVILAEQAGLPRNIVFVMAGILLVAGIAIPAIQARTMSPADWMVARRGASLAVNATALSASMLTGWTVATLAGQFFGGSPLAIAWITGPMLALALSAFMIAPFLRKSGAATPAHFVARRFKSVSAGGILALVVAAAGVLILWSQMRLAGQFAHLLFDIDQRMAIIFAAVLVGLAILPGGLRGMLRVNTVIFAFLATAYLGPLIWASIDLGTFPVPQLFFGHGALRDVGDIEQQLSQLGFARLGGQVDGVATADHALTAAIAMCLFLGAGLCAMPFVLGHFPASRDADGARKTAGWAILLVALVLAAAPALAAFTKLFLYRGILGLTSEEIETGASWLLVWSGKASVFNSLPMAHLCGKVVHDTAQAVAACGGNPDYVIGPADIRFSAETITLAMADIFSMPGIGSGLIAAAVLAGTLAIANATAFSIGSNLSGGLLRRASGKDRQSLTMLFRARLWLIAVLAGTAWLAIGFERPPADTFMWALAIGAGIIAPILVGAIWWDRMNAYGAMAGMCAGSAVLAVQAWVAWFEKGGEASVYGIPIKDLPPVPGLEDISPAVSAAIYALAATLAGLVLASYLTGRHDNAAAIDAIRRPDSEALAGELEV
ncbi:MAG: hypothetical protein LJE67_05655 [Salaquimonas sp.]|nr:hypothetical protein [Salaquimonas sp.]